jgi:short-subunit dehydrogenase
MAKWALITGGTVGIGEAFSRLLASESYNLVLNARDVVKLEERAASLRQKYNIEVEILPADVSVDCEKIEAYIASHQIDVLVNNAGYGLNESFTRSTIEQEQNVLDVLVRAPMRLTHAVLPQMKARKSGIIVNVSSVASFIAGGHYSASKSYLTVLSESLHTEMKSCGVTVTALCPGFTRTEFHQRAGMKMSELPGFLWLDVDEMVRTGWNDAKNGKAVSVPGLQYKFLRLLTKLAPRHIVRRMGIQIRRRQR